MKHWNHRVFETKQEDGSSWFAIHEVYYDDDGHPDLYTSNPITVEGESLQDLRVNLERMLRAIEKPILTDQMFS